MPNYLVNLTSGQLQALRELSAATNVPMSCYVRQGIDLVLSGRVPVDFAISGTVVSGTALVIRAGC